MSNDLYFSLCNLKSYNDLKNIFTSLNYELENIEIPKSSFPQDILSDIKDAKILSSSNKFNIIYLKLTKLLLSPQRKIINKLLKDHPFSLFVFSDEEEKNYHFVNVKYDENLQNRRLFRRIIIGPDERLHTASERLSLIEVKDEKILPLLLQSQHDKAFDIEEVTKEFYLAYKRIFEQTISSIRGKESYQNAYNFTHLLFNRLMFLYFIQRKGWLKSIDGKGYDKNFIYHLWSFYLQKGKRKDHFYDDYLKPLFFKAFKNQFDYGKNLSSELFPVYSQMPYLNGGLFQEEDVDFLEFKISDEIFYHLLNQNTGLLQHYNFTVREDLPLDVEVALDHDMLGKVYESVVNEGERGTSGMFYTPRTEVNFMCRLSLIDYLDRFKILPQDELINFVINAEYPENLPKINPEILCKIREYLKEIKVVDPACGSGAFLVGMMKVISGILKTISNILDETYDTFKERKKILGESLYGVDVKPWAIKICELRLWLTLIVETEKFEIDLKKEPLLPNLDFNIRQGDSLVEEVIPGKQLVIRSKYSDIHYLPNIKKQITEIQNLKQAYYKNKSGVTKREIEIKKHQFIRSFFIEGQKEIQKQIAKLQSATNGQFKQMLLDVIKSPEQTELSLKDITNKEINKKIEGLQTGLKEYQNMFETISSIGEKDFFLWDIDFAEIFYENSGFDIVIGNPPYVRQENIAPPTKDVNDYDLDIWRDLKKEYKEKLIRSVKLHWQELKEDRKCDLYIYFYLHGLALLKKGGTFCFITSNSWLDVGYGAVLQEFLLKNIKIKAIFDNQAKRSFSTADVNTIIALFSAPSKNVVADFSLRNNLAKFVIFKKPFEFCVNSENLTKIFDSKEILATDDFRVYPKKQIDLLGEGWEYPEDITEEHKERFKFNIGKYTGNKWGGKYLRAPDIFFKILEKGKGKLVRLGDVAEVKYGLKTGATKYFFVTEEIIKNFNIEEDYLFPVFTTIKETDNIVVRKENLRFKLFYCNKSKKELERLKHLGALSYIKFGEENDIHKVPNLRNKPIWYSQGKQIKPDMIINQFIGDRFIFIKGGEFFATNVFFIVKFNSIDHEIGVALSNSTFTYLSAEILGRKTYGIGVMYIYGPEIEKLLIVNTDLLKGDEEKKINRIFKIIEGRAVKSIFTELGINPNLPIRSQTPNPLPDRKELDDIVFDVLDLTEDERNEVYWSVCELVKNRLEKARSV